MQRKKQRRNLKSVLPALPLKQVQSICLINNHQRKSKIIDEAVYIKMDIN
jgi:hypothetical protein